MNEEKLTHLELKLLNEVIRPAIKKERDHLFFESIEMMGSTQLSETLNFTDLLASVKSFYKRHLPPYSENRWHEIVISANL